MKKKITTLIMALSLAGSTFAQRQNSQPQMGADSKLLSQTTQGDYTVSRYLVKESSSDNDEFSVKYRINISKLISNYDNNAEEIKGLKSFIADIKQDTLKSITAINVSGYASPDGPMMGNQKLAMARAEDFRKYLNSNCGMGKYSGTTTADALKWSAAIEPITNSSIPQKSTVLAIIESGDSESAIETKLRAMHDSWNYMKVAILPPMRCVELQVKYNSWKVVETRTLSRSRTPQKGSTIHNNYFILIDEDSSDVLINSSNAPLDYDNCKCREKLKFKRFHDKYKERQRYKKSHRNRREYLYERERVRIR
ncbi:MAG: hypothetical protein SNG27_06630 [Rikenellaceae bacterium]